MSKSRGDAVGTFDDLLVAVNENTEKIEAIDSQVDDIETQVEKIKELEKEVKKIKEFEKEVEKIKDLEIKMQELEDEDIPSALSKHDERIDEIETDVDEFRSKIEKLQDQLQELLEQVKPKEKKRKLGTTASSSSSSKKECLAEGGDDDEDEDSQDKNIPDTGSLDSEEKLEYLAYVYDKFIPGLWTGSFMVRQLVSFIDAHAQWFNSQRFPARVPYYFGKFAEKTKAVLSDIKLQIENNQEVAELADTLVSKKRKH